MVKKYSYIPTRLKNAAENDYVAGAEDILDDTLNKTQEEINGIVLEPSNGLKHRVEQLEEQVSFDGSWEAAETASAVVSGSPGGGKITTANAVRGAIDVRTGYFKCTTVGSTAEKAVTADGYVLSRGGGMRIFMEHANTADNATLNINSTGPKALFYNGERAGSVNSWDEGEVINVYYDETANSNAGAYFASNAQGGGKAVLSKSVDIPYDTIVRYSMSDTTYGTSNYLSVTVYKVDGYDSITITSKTSACPIAFMNSYNRPTASGDSLGTFATGYNSKISQTANTTKTYKLPDDCHYVMFQVHVEVDSQHPSSIVLNGNGVDILSDEIDEIRSEIEVLGENQFDVSNTTTSPSANRTMSVDTETNSITTTVSTQKNTDSANKFTLPMLEDGKKYRLSCNYTTTIGEVRLDIWSSSAYMQSLGKYMINGSGTYSAEFIYSSSMMYISVWIPSYSRAAAYITLSNIAIQTIDDTKSISDAVDELTSSVDSIESSLTSQFLDTTNLYQGGTENSNGNPNTLSDCVRTDKLPLGSATSVIIYNNKVLEDGYRLKFKFSWYNSSGTYQTYTTWQYGTDVEVPSSALGGYVIVVFTRRNSSDGSINPTTKENIALYKLYLNIYGSIGLEDRVANLEETAGKDYSYIDDISKGLAPKSITICTWNIGHFALGNAKDSTITGSDYATKLDQFRDLIYNTINPRVIMLNEYSAVFGTDSESVSRRAKDVLFNDFAIKFEGLQNNFSCNALYGNTYLANIEQHSYACLPHEIINQQAQIYADNYYYVSADLYLEGRLVKLIVTHMAYGGYQDDQCNELIALLEDYDRAVIIGDLNINGDSQTLIDCFDGTGYTIGNSNIPTYPSGTDKILDNIIYKGVVVSSMSAVTSSLSDHYPLVATITV